MRPCYGKKWENKCKDEDKIKVIKLLDDRKGAFFDEGRLR